MQLKEYKYYLFHKESNEGHTIVDPPYSAILAHIERIAN